MKVHIYAKTVTQLVLFPDEFDSWVFLHPEMAPLRKSSAGALFLQAKLPFDFFQLCPKID